MSAWGLYLRACNRSPRTIQSDQEAALQFDAWLHDLDLPVDAAQIERRHIEAWLAHLLERWSPSTAAAAVPVAEPVLPLAGGGRRTRGQPKAKMRPGAGA